MIYGCEQALIETNPVKRLAFRYLGATHLGDRSRNHYLMRALRKLTLPENANVLNAGCANGAHSFYLAERYPGWKITGIEIESEPIARATAIAEKKGTRNLSFHKGDLHQIRFAELFHLIFSMHVLTYLKNDLEVLKRFSRALKRGGYLILSIPTPPAPSPLPRPLQRLFQPSRPPVSRPSVSIERTGYSNEEIIHKLNEAGFLPPLHHPSGRTALAVRLGNPHVDRE
ncbi:MAG: class I SAM-dependent methyltransferase [Candidatus Manganitrophus sp.]|nr:class I SAM-dependent methyltransferase [Candidatus Manganitrophus sp.]